MHFSVNKLVFVVACVGLLGGGPVAAEPAPDDVPSQRLMIYGPGVDDVARLEAEKLRLRMDRRGLAPYQAMAIADTLAVVQDDTLRAYGDILVHECQQEPTPPDVVLEVIDQGLDLFMGLDYEAALAAFEVAEARLPCLTGYLPEGKLSDLYFFEGLAAFYVRGSQDARACFARALAAEPSRPWDDRFPPAPQQIFLDAGKEILHTPPRQVLMRDPTGLAGDLRIDSARELASDVESRSLCPGVHLLQWQLADGGVRTLQVELVPGGQLVLLTGAGFLAAVLDGGRDDGLGRVVAPFLGQLADEQGADEIVIVRVDEAPQVSLFDPVEQDFEITERERFKSNTEAERQRWGPRGGISLGVGFLTLVDPSDNWDFQYVVMTLHGEFRLIGGLYVDIAGNLGVRRGEVDRDSLMVAPSSRMGIKYALKLRHVRPYLGVAGQTNMFGPQDVALGGGALVGMALEFPKNPALRMGVEVFGGKVRNWTIQIVGQVGVYY